MKIFAMLVLGTMSMGAVAATTATANIVLTSASAGTDKVKLYEDASYTSAFDNGADATKVMNNANSRSVNIYSIVEGKNCATIFTDNLIGLKVALQTNKVDENYTMSFENVSGRKLALKDNVTGTITIIENGKNYAFTAAKNVTLTDRFEIVEAVLPYEICHRYGKLQITGYPESAANVVIKDEAGAEVKNVAITDHVYQEIDLTGLAAGHYTVEANGQTLTISVQ